MGITFVKRCRCYSSDYQIDMANKPIKKMLLKSAASLRRLLNWVLSQGLFSAEAALPGEGAGAVLLPIAPGAMVFPEVSKT